MVKIKKEITMSLDELIKWAKENNITSKTYKNNFGDIVSFDMFGDISVSGYFNIDSNIFVEIEEEITEETQIYRLLELSDSLNFKKGGWEDLNVLKSSMYGNKSISEVKSDKSKKFYMLNEDDTMTLLWKDGELL